jgi:hypothetical protein
MAAQLPGYRLASYQLDAHIISEATVHDNPKSPPKMAA